MVGRHSWVQFQWHGVHCSFSLFVCNLFKLLIIFLFVRKVCFTSKSLFCRYSLQNCGLYDIITTESNLIIYSTLISDPIQIKEQENILEAVKKEKHLLGSLVKKMNAQKTQITQVRFFFPQTLVSISILISETGC